MKSLTSPLLDVLTTLAIWKKCLNCWKQFFYQETYRTICLFFLVKMSKLVKVVIRLWSILSWPWISAIDDKAIWILFARNFKIEPIISLLNIIERFFVTVITYQLYIFDIIPSWIAEGKMFNIMVWEIIFDSLIYSGIKYEKYKGSYSQIF